MDFELAKALTKAFIDGLDDVYMKKAPFMSNAWHGKTDIAFTDMCGKPDEISSWRSCRMGRSRLYAS